MSWNYRIIKDTFTEYGSGEDIPLYYIGEVYYEGDTPKAYSGEVAPYGETLDELHQDLNRMREALDKPYLEAW